MTNTILASKTGRLDALTGLRWWAALFVFCYHMREFAPLPTPAAQIFDQGFYGVTLFFVLSGFVLTWSARPGVRVDTFYWRRFARIWPLHIVTLIPALFVFYTFTAEPTDSFIKPFDLVVILLTVFVLQAWTHNPTVLFGGNPASWTLSVEFFFYALHPWISKILNCFRARGALLLALGVVILAFGYRAAVALFPQLPLGQVPIPVVRLSEFMLGMCLAWAVRAGWRSSFFKRRIVFSFTAMLGALLIASQVGKIKYPFGAALNIFANELVTLACGAIIIALAFVGLQGKRSWFASAVQVKLGQWSFAFYLIHGTIIYGAIRIFGRFEAGWQNLFWFIALGALSTLAAWLLYRFVEHPIEGKLRRFKDRADQRRAARS